MGYLRAISRSLAMSIVLAVSTAQGQAETSTGTTDSASINDADALYQVSLVSYRAASSADAEEALRLMRMVRENLDGIVERHPSSDLAVQVLLGGKVGEIDITLVDTVIRTAETAQAASEAPAEPVKELEASDSGSTDGARDTRNVVGQGGAEALYETALASYRDATRAEAEEARNLMRSVRETLDRIVDMYPSSDRAVEVLLGGSVGEIDIVVVDTAISNPSGDRESLQEASEAAAEPARAHDAKELTKRSTGEANEDPSSAEKLYQAALILYREAQAVAKTEDARLLMHSVRETLDYIVERYPSSDRAVEVVLGDQVGEIDIAVIEVAIALDSPMEAEPTPPESPPYISIADPERAKEAEEALELNRQTRRVIQRRLTLVGLRTRGVDGIFGPGTRAAISEWQARNDWHQTGFIDAYQRDVLFSETETAFAKWQAEASRRARQRREAQSEDQAATPSGRYVGADGCPRRADGSRIPHHSFLCDLKGMFRVK